MRASVPQISLLSSCTRLGTGVLWFYLHLLTKTPKRSHGAEASTPENAKPWLFIPQLVPFLVSVR